MSACFALEFYGESIHLPVLWVSIHGLQRGSSLTGADWLPACSH